MGRKSFGRQIRWPALLLVIAMIGACTGTDTGDTTGEGDTGTTEAGATATTAEEGTATTAGQGTEGEAPNPGVTPGRTNSPNGPVASSSTSPSSRTTGASRRTFRSISWC